MHRFQVVQSENEVDVVDGIASEGRVEGKRTRRELGQDGIRAIARLEKTHQTQAWPRGRRADR